MAERAPSLLDMARYTPVTGQIRGYAPGELEAYYANSINGPQGYPDFRGMVNPAGMDAFMRAGPMSNNIEDWRGYMDSFPAAAERTRRGVRSPARQGLIDLR